MNPKLYPVDFARTWPTTRRKGKTTMGIAAYNRGSKAIRQQITDELKTYKPSEVVSVAHPNESEFPSNEDYKPNDLRSTGVKVGDRVFCTVTRARGWFMVVEVKGSGDSLRIKVDALNGWGYGHNFTFNPPEWMTKGDTQPRLP